MFQQWGTMKKIHIQCRTSLIKLASVARGMHKAGLLLSRPSDILDASLDASEKLFNAVPFLSEEDAEAYLQRVGFKSSDQIAQRKIIMDAVSKKSIAMDELEDMIEKVGKAPSSVEEIKEMLSCKPTQE